MRCLVTGGSGFLGSHVADELTKKGHNVTIYDKKKSLYLKKKQKFIKGDICDYNKLKNVVSNSQVVYNFAGLSDLNNAISQPILSVKLNVLATVQLMDLCSRFKVKRFIHASSVYAISKDGGFYRSSKKAAEEYVEEFKNIHNLKFTVLRFGSLYGSRSQKSNGLNKILAKALNENKIVYSGTRNSIRQYINVEDAARACVKILSKKFENKYVILTGNKKIKINNLLNFIKKIVNVRTPIKYLKSKNKFQGHYVSNPFTYKNKIGNRLSLKGQKNFFLEIKKFFKNKGFV